MDIIIDTFSWKKLDLINKKNLLNVSQLYEWVNINITHEVKREIEHFKLKSCDFPLTKILPIKNKSIYEDAQTLLFDNADSEILSNGTKEEDFYIITEDVPLLKMCVAYNFDVLQLIDLFRLFTYKDLIDKRTLYRLVKYLRELKNISIKKEKKIKEWLRDIN